MTRSAAASFIDKWQARWPEWRIGTAFIPAWQRDPAFAWFALLQELTDAAWAGADPTPGLAKLAWWNEELRGWSGGARRHPLGAVLQPRPAPWALLAASLVALQASRGQQQAQGSPDASLQVVAEALVQCEGALFGAGVVDAADTAGLAFDLGAERALLLGDAVAIGEVLGVLPAPLCGHGPRRVQATFLRERLRRAAAGESAIAAPWRSLWLAWRAARAG